MMHRSTFIRFMRLFFPQALRIGNILIFSHTFLRLVRLRVCWEISTPRV